MRTSNDWDQPCPNPECAHYSRRQCGNVSAIATYLTQSGKRRIFRCHTCETCFSETRETVFFDLRTSEEKVMMALKMLLVRVDLAGICFVLGVTEETVLAWLRRAAQQAEAINRHLLRNLPVTQVQLDEMWNFIARQGDRILSCSGEHRQQVVFIETTEKCFLSQANLIQVLLTQKIESDVPHHSHIFRGMVLPDAAAVFIARHI
jgi:transposase-like protein